mgnify:CR=1 FL=1
MAFKIVLGKKSSRTRNHFIDARKTFLNVISPLPFASSQAVVVLWNFVSSCGVFASRSNNVIRQFWNSGSIFKFNSTQLNMPWKLNIIAYTVCSVRRFHVSPNHQIFNHWILFRFISWYIYEKVHGEDLNASSNYEIWVDLNRRTSRSDNFVTFK